MKGFKTLFLFILLFSILPLTAEVSPYNEDSRFILSGFSVPPVSTYLDQIPLEHEGRFPLILKDSGTLWLLVFLEETHPLYRETKTDLFEAAELWEIPNLRIAFISAHGEGDFRDSDSHAARMLGFMEQPGIILINGEGKVIAWASGLFPQWKEKSLATAMMESAVDP